MRRWTALLALLLLLPLGFAECFLAFPTYSEIRCGYGGEGFAEKEFGYIAIGDGWIYAGLHCSGKCIIASEQALGLDWVCSSYEEIEIELSRGAEQNYWQRKGGEAFGDFPIKFDSTISVVVRARCKNLSEKRGREYAEIDLSPGTAPKAVVQEQGTVFLERVFGEEEWVVVENTAGCVKDGLVQKYSKQQPSNPIPQQYLASPTKQEQKPEYSLPSGLSGWIRHGYSTVILSGWRGFEGAKKIPGTEGYCVGESGDRRVLGLVEIGLAAGGGCYSIPAGAESVECCFDSDCPSPQRPFCSSASFSCTAPSPTALASLPPQNTAPATGQAALAQDSLLAIVLGALVVVGGLGYWYTGRKKRV